jgi:putative tricarboxylic transport membrane protein
MDTLQYLLNGFGVALTVTNLVVAALGALIGTIVGMLPGLGPINGVAILMPIAFALKLPPETALILLAAVYMGCEFGGRISAILLNVPGDAGAIMTTLDGYPMARKGQAGVALSISAWSSFVGSLVATIGIVLFAPLLARWALAFGPAEYFALMCFAFACITGLMGDAPMKAALAAVSAWRCPPWAWTPTRACTASPAGTCTCPTASSSSWWSSACSRSARSC